ncbi:hypothetical protein C8J57DRAFT_1252678 [Mycena rebaudengoi]|nr:hypothetical protein C8J57DRAFT_1252678 [Mycena rebaudengoi]
MYTAMHASFGGGIRVHLEIKIRAAKDVGSGKKEERDDLRNPGGRNTEDSSRCRVLRFPVFFPASPVFELKQIWVETFVKLYVVQAARPKRPNKNARQIQDKGTRGGWIRSSRKLKTSKTRHTGNFPDFFRERHMEEGK